MKKFTRFLMEEALTTKVINFGRFNPPHNGHGLVVDKVKKVADELGADHEIIASASQDHKKNPLTQEQKMRHLGRMFPGTNFTPATKDAPTLMHHAARIHAEGYNHLVMVAGDDRKEDYERLLNAYNGKPDRTGKVPYNFKKITVISSGKRDPDSEGTAGASATGQRKHAENDDFESFRKNLPAEMKDSHARELFKDTRHGMGMQVKESVERFYRRFVEENSIGSGSGVRGMGYVTGDPAGTELNNYVVGNVADSDQRNNIIFQMRQAHDAVHNAKETKDKAKVKR
jgi:phosphopantetheine adenylyltransferase